MKIKLVYLAAILSTTVLLNACVKNPEAISPGQQKVAQPVAQETVTAQNTFVLPSANDDVVGKVQYVTAQRGDTISNLALKYDLGYETLELANPNINPQKPIRSGTTVVLPTMYILPPAQYRQGIVINIPELRLYYFTNSQVMIFPVALGREGWRTPIAKTYVYKKEAAPTWNVPESIRQYYFEKYGQEHPTTVGPGPENPLGDYAIYLQMTGYLIHGTNAPSSIGHFVSSGCVRMYNQNVATLFANVNKGTPVNIIYYTSLVGWHDNQLYIQSYPEVSHQDGLYEVQDVFPNIAVRTAMIGHQVTVDWTKVQEAVRKHNGIPTIISG